jgi:hypothetical protein
MKGSGNYYFHPQRLDRIPSGSVKFPKAWFENVIKRIEHTKPVPEGGDTSASPNRKPLIQCKLLPQGDGTEIVFNGDEVTLTVCVDGAPKELKFLTRKQD